MAKEICISTTPHETRLAIVEDDQLTEIYYERENEYTLAGSIYKGKVTRVLPGMQSAFVDVGLERDAFLYVTDFLEEQEDPADFEATKQNGSPRKERTDGGRNNGGRRGEQPPAQTPRGSALAEAEGEELVLPAGQPASSEPAAGQGEEFQEGTRRWRGRRGRRRGMRGNREAAGAEPTSAGTEPVEGAPAYDDESSSDESPIAIEAAGEPARERNQQRGQDSGRRREAERGERRSEGRAPREQSAPASSGTMITLPGEALQKYGQQPVEIDPMGAGLTIEVDESPRPAYISVRPSTLVDQPIAWDGKSAALPGESLSRYRDQPAKAAAEPSQTEPEVHALSHVPAAEHSSAAAIDEAFPPARPEEALQEATAEQAFVPMVREEEEPSVVAEHAGQPSDAPLSEGHEEGEFNPESASASHRVDPSSPSEFRLSSLFGRDHESNEKQGGSGAAEAETGHETHDVSSESAESSAALHADTRSAENAEAGSHSDEAHHDHPHQDHLHTDDTLGHLAETGQAAEAEQTAETQGREAAALEHIHAFTPGDGQVEEEVIDEDEYDFAPLPEHASGRDDDDMGDLVEEETQASGAAEFGEVIREAQIERQVTSSDDEDFEDSDESDDEGGEEEDQPATAVAGEEGAGAPRRAGRNDRQRGGRDRRGRGGRPGGGRRQSAQTSDLPIISELLKQGQEILVQIAKEPIAKKGARITSHIALPGRFLVFMPTVNHVGVSRKIWSDEERQRLKRVLISEKGDASGGFIVRTAAENASEDELRADLRFLISLWNEIKQRSDAAKAPALIYHDLNLIERILRDQVSDSFSTIWVDSEAEYERIVRFLNRFQPSLVRRVKLYTKETPLFEQFGIQDEISKALKSKVWLKSGGSIVINQTEALVAIDINTGKYVGKTARLEDTILKTNLDAIPEIVRQIRLRDLGGIIVIDFIDMDERKNRHKVMQALEEELKSDRAPSKVLQFNDFGLVAITRKRVKQSLERTLSVQCNICAGTGMVKSPITVANEIYIEMRKMQKHFERHDVMLRVHPEVVKTLKGSNAKWLNELEEMTGRTIIVKSDPALHPEQFDIH